MVFFLRLGRCRNIVLSSQRRAFSFNINHALKKAEEGESFRELAEKPVQILQGIGPKHTEELEALGIKTIQQLADYKFFHLARTVTVLAETEEENFERDADAMKMNLFKGIDKEFHSSSLNALVKLPVHALKGIAPDTGGKALKLLGVKTIADLAEFKYCRWSEAIVAAAKFEN